MRHAAALLCLACWGAGCSGADEAGSNGNGSTLTVSPDAALAQAFGPGISVAPDRSPAVFHGDFNGDGLPDLIAFARADRGHDPVPAEVQVLRPWSTPGEPAPADLSRGADVTLAIVHGSSATRRPAGFILHDPATVSILDARPARDAFVIDRAGASDLNLEVGRLARGDVFVLPTEAGIDTFVYWDGSTYRAFQPIEYP